jgi:hypothetical protein
MSCGFNALAQDLALSLVAALALGLAAPPAAEARKFDFKSEGIATYVRGTYAASLVGGDAYANSSGAGTTVDRTVSANYSGEAGLVLGLGRANLRLGGEFLLPAPMGSITGSSATGATLFSLNSKLTAVLAMANIEYAIKQGTTWKFLASVGGGYGWVALDNVYTMTAAGTTASGLASFTESSAATAPAAEAALAIEFLFAEQATLVLDGGYRYMKVGSLAYTSTQATYTGSMASGATVINMNGEQRSLDLGGPFAGISLRFYF